MILSCLQGHMGQVRTGGGHPPESALCAIGDFCFFAGRPDPALVRQADRPLLVPRTGDWAPVIRAVWGRRAVPFLRYALCGAPEDFDRDRLAAFAAALPPGFSLSPHSGRALSPADGPGSGPGTCAAISRDGLRLRPAWAGGHRSWDGVPAAGAALLRRLGRRHRDPVSTPGRTCAAGGWPVQRRPADHELPWTRGSCPHLGRPRPALRRPGAEAGLPPGPPLPRLSSGPDSVRKKIARFSYGCLSASQSSKQGAPPLIP